MSEYRKDEALAFIDAMRLTLNGKVGFTWMVERLANLSAFIESITAENDRMKAYLDSADLRAGFDAFVSSTRDEAASGATHES